MWAARFMVYLAGLGAGFLALSGYATFDPATWMLDIHPFDLREFVLTGVGTAANGLAAFAAWKGWARK